MTEAEQKDIFRRIDALTLQNKASFGKMTIHQVMPHCADQFRMAMGTKLAKAYGQVDPKQIIAMHKEGKDVPTPEGFGQVEGDGTAPTDLENDKAILKAFIKQFRALPEDHPFYPHPYFGEYDKKKWSSLMVFHLNHHLNQFGVQHLERT